MSRDEVQVVLADAYMELAVLQLATTKFVLSHLRFVFNMAAARAALATLDADEAARRREKLDQMDIDHQTRFAVVERKAGDAIAGLEMCADRVAAAREQMRQNPEGH